MNDLSKIQLKDEDFIRKNSLQCTLFLQLSEKVCRAVIKNDSQDVFVKEYLTSEFLDGSWPLINLRFKETILLVAPETFLFVPEEFENDDEENILTPFLGANSSILTAKFDQNPINTYFTINKLTSDFQALFRNSHLVLSANMLIQEVLNLDSEEKEIIGINFYSNSIELAYVKNKEFIFYNRFPIENADDFNYFLLSIVEQFGIQIAQTRFYLMGETDSTDSYFDRLKKYTSHINYLYGEDDLNDYYLLLKLSKCESLVGN